MVYNNHPMLDSPPEIVLTAFLSSLNLYVLKSLHIEWFLDTSRQAWASSHSVFVTFLQSLEPTLESLRLGYIPMSEEQVLDCLRAVPFLTFLELLFTLGEEPEAPAITDKLFKGLTFTQTRGSGPAGYQRARRSGTLLPLVQSMKLQCHGSDCSERELVRFVDSRADAESLELHSLELRTQVPVLHMENLQREVSRWRSKGIEIVT